MERRITDQRKRIVIKQWDYLKRRSFTMLELAEIMNLKFPIVYKWLREHREKQKREVKK